MRNEFLGKCGFYCGSCPTFLSGGCGGCTSQPGGTCYTRDCVICRNLNFCGECGDFPCGVILTRPRTTLLDKNWLEWKKRSRAGG